MKCLARALNIISDTNTVPAVAYTEKASCAASQVKFNASNSDFKQFYCQKRTLDCLPEEQSFARRYLHK